MKRITRRMVAGGIGLVVGWYAAGVVTVPIQGVGVSFAGDTKDVVHSGHEAAAEHADHDDGHADQNAHGVSAGRDSAGGHVEHDGAYAAAQRLVPRPEDVSWYGCVVKVIGGLFVAAVVLGIPALKLRGPELPEPVAAGHGDGGAHH